MADISEERADELANEFGEKVATEVRGNDKDFITSMDRVVKVIKENMDTLRSIVW